MRPDRALACLLALAAAWPAAATATYQTPGPCAEAAVAGDGDPVLWRACFEAPTARYGHNVTGGPEWAALTLTIGSGEPVRRVLPATRVFEDMVPRLVDLDGNGRPEILVVEADTTEGAQLVIYAEERGRLVHFAATPAIGRRFRWLAPAAVGDLDGDGAVEIALVVTPHIDGRLEIWGFDAGGLTRRAAVGGVSHHRIGEPHVTAGLRDCGEGPEIVLPDFEWSRMLAARYSDGTVALREIAPTADAATLARLLACEAP